MSEMSAVLWMPPPLVPLVLEEIVPPPVAARAARAGFVLSREAKPSFRTPPPSAVLVLPSIVKLPRTEMNEVFENPPPPRPCCSGARLSIR